jgi:hypothetical protein
MPFISTRELHRAKTRLAKSFAYIDEAIHTTTPMSAIAPTTMTNDPVAILPLTFDGNSLLATVPHLAH